jgi:hypothetical protein
MPALLDLLDFVDEKLREALDNPESQLAAATEPGCAMPVIWEGLREDDAIGLTFLLMLRLKGRTGSVPGASSAG